MRHFSTLTTFLAVLLSLAEPLFATNPQPVVVTSSTQFLGYDGRWSPITVQVGTSEQSQWVSVLPNTLSQETWVVGPAGCDGTITCQTERGGLFYSNLSSTFQNRGYYELGLDPQLGYTDYGDYGLDTLTLNNVVSEPNQIVAIINTTDFWLGQVGLGVQEVLLNGSTNQLSFLSSLVQNNSFIPSHSYGYTAGAYYRLKSVPASLTLGGIDANRFTPNDLSFKLSSSYAPVVAINSISLSTSSSSLPPNWDSNPMQLLNSSQANTFTIDTTTPFMWLPPAVCDNFASALNLTYNETLQLYLFGDNSSSPELLNSWSLNFTFTLSDLPNSAHSIDLSLPYDAFNLQLSFPFPNLDATFGSAPTNYFPLRRAASSNQYTIGRAFLQETYLTVDYERQNFSISQAVFSEEAVSNVNLFAITRPSDSIFPGPPGARSSGLSTGAKVGIGAGIGIAAIAMILLLFMLLSRRNKNRKESVQENSKRRSFFGRPRRSPGSGTTVSELLGDKRHPAEVAADSANSRFELAGSAAIELPAADVSPTYFAGPDGQRGSATLRNDPRRPVELESRRSIAKEAEARGGASDHSGSPVPPYSPAELHQRLSPSISPYSARFSRVFGTMSSGEQGISPVGNGHGAQSRNSSQTSESSPISPEATTARSPGNFGPGTHDSRFGNGSNSTWLTPQAPARPPSRSSSRSSRFVEEHLSATEQQRSATSGNSARFSWED